MLDFLYLTTLVFDTTLVLNLHLDLTTFKLLNRNSLIKLLTFNNNLTVLFVQYFSLFDQIQRHIIVYFLN